MQFLDELDARIGKRIRDLLGRALGSPRYPQLLEVYNGVLRDAANQIQPVSRGKRLFPFNEILIRISCPEGPEKAAYEAVFVEGRSELENDLRFVLASGGCDPTPRVKVRVQLIALTTNELQGQPFQIEYRRISGTPAEEAPEIPPAFLVTLRGTTRDPELRIARARVNIGRLRDVVDGENRVIRRNDLVFPECPDPPNRSVSRQQAHIEFDSGHACFRLFDDKSTRGTNVIRNGKVFRIMTGGLGFQLTSGDEIHFGSARVRFELRN
jgi:hypothetical protein